MSTRVLAERAFAFAATVDDVTRLDDVALLDAVDRVGELRRLVDGLGAALAGELEQRATDPDPGGGVARRRGEKSTAVLVGLHAGIDLSEARDWCRVGVAIAPRMNLQGEPLPPVRPELADAIGAGLVSVDAAARIVATLDRVAPYAPAGDLPRLEGFLVDQAQQLTPRDLARVCREIPDRYDPDGAEPRDDLLRTKAGVWMRQTRDGLTEWTIRLHPEAAGFAHTALDARTAPRRTPTFTDPATATGGSESDTTDTRTLPQRRLDALISIMRESLQHDHGRVAGSAVTMMVTIPLESLLSGIGAAKIAGIDEPISAGTARRLAAQADIIPVVLGTGSEILDQGRAVRLATQGQRNALTVRDEGCIWPGCNAPPGWCEVAHILAWILGGTTDLNNLALLCPFHHRRFDNDDWTLQWHDDTPYLIPPPWIDPTRKPRPAGKLPTAA